MSRPGRIAELDALRGIAALAVVLFHYTSKYHEEYGHDDPVFLLDKGYLGVELFFMISGYVIFMTVERVKTAGGFAWLRFSRLFPVYWTAILLTFGVVLLFGLDGREVTWKAFLFNFTMLQDLFGIPPVDGAYWSLLPELLFYLLMILLILSGLRDRIRWVSAAWLVFIVLNRFLDFPDLLAVLLNLRYGMLFLAGIHFYRLHQQKANGMKMPAGDLLLVLLAWGTCFLVSTSPTDSLIISAFFATFFLLIDNRLGPLRFRPLVFLGSVSYPLYLVHQNIGYVIMNETGQGFWLSIGLALTVAFVLAVFIHFLVEIPALRALRAFFGKFD